MNFNWKNPLNFDDCTGETNDLIGKLENKCPNCESILTEKKHKDFVSVKCPKCKTVITVTSESNNLKYNAFCLGMFIFGIGIILGVLLS